MSYVVWFGLHGAAAEEFATPAEALAGIRGLEQRGAKYIQPTDPEGREVTIQELERMIASQGASG